MTTESRFKTQLLFDWWYSCNGEEQERIAAVLDNYLAGELTPGRVLECLSGVAVANFAIDRLRQAIDERIAGCEALQGYVEGFTRAGQEPLKVVQIAAVMGRQYQWVYALRSDGAIYETSNGDEWRLLKPVPGC